eukprot:TRINITY_DN211_c0_g1_i1.p1 TRINITY_DN211_c0_g1~~TRINITY_DN211_c0_g1_i1.p1  ORF type:complete len:442 (-),score=113.76 TRINITY_DN211_c0_g1_i1:124-1449(-)
MSDDNNHHSFMNHHHSHSTEPDWPTSADLYAPSFHHHHHHHQAYDTSGLNGLAVAAGGADADDGAGGGGGGVGAGTMVDDVVGSLPHHHHHQGFFGDAQDVAASLAAVQQQHHQQQQLPPPPAAVAAGGKRGGRKSSKTAALAAAAGPNGSENVEVIVCQGTATVIPKARSDVERRYICNGQPIHRVTFWRHRKHGCPHVVGEGGDGTAEGFNSAPQPRPKRAPRSNSNKMDKLVSVAAEKERELDASLHTNDLSAFGNPYDMGHFGVPAPLGAAGVKFKPPTSLGYTLAADGMVDVSASGSNQYGLQAGFDIAPGSVPSQLDSGSLGPHIPTFPGASTQAGPTQYGFIPRPPPSSSGSSSSNMMPPFSLLTDALNLYYAPYRSTELEDEEISSPIRTNYVHSSSPYQSDGRSEASDFMEDPHAAHHSSDGMFKNYLERNE